MKTLKYFVMVLVLTGFVFSCRNEPAPQKPKIEKLLFEESVKNVFIGDSEKVNITVEPKEAKKYEKIEYRAAESGFIDIKADSGNESVIFEGLKRGSTVIVARVNDIADYLTVNVLGAGEHVPPYITMSDYVIECKENERKSIVASLAGGTPLDDSGFIWNCKNQKIIDLQSTGNVGVFDSLSIGDTVVTISHPKAKFSVDVLVYVTGIDEVPVYITTDHNVVNINTGDSNFQYSVDLMGGDSSSYYKFDHSILDGSDVISLRSNNNIGTINPKKKGIARIEVKHEDAKYPVEIIVIVNEIIEYCYIDLSNTLIILNEGESDFIKAEMAGDVSEDYVYKFSFENENDDILYIEQFGDKFRLGALQKGKSVVKIKNEYADFDREVLVIVNGPGDVINNETYITTNQNVITTQVDADDVLLTMMLVGGIEADRNNFTWTVDDGSIINVSSAHGKVNYTNRSMINYEERKFEAQAVIKALKVGTAKITLENPKAKNTFSVIVKVYKKGVFEAVPVVIGGMSVYKLKIGEPYQASLGVVTGSERSLSKVTWESGDSNIFTVSGAGLTGMLEGKKNGITTLTVSGNGVKNAYVATVISGDDEYLDTMPFMYVYNPFISVIKGESLSFKVICENMGVNEINAITVFNNSGDIIEVHSFKDTITVMGLSFGEGEMVIGGDGLNTVTVKVVVEDYAINPDMPYYLRTDKLIYGVAKGNNLNISVDLVGASEVNNRGIIWNIVDSNVALIEGNGKSCFVTPRNVGQTVLKVNHPKSNNSLEIVVYVVEAGENPESKIVMYVKENNLLLRRGETRYISITTNASETLKNSFQWNVQNAEIIDYSISSDKTKAHIQAIDLGNAVITVSGSNTMVPVVIYISIVDSNNISNYINVPSIVEMVVGSTISVNAVINGNINQGEINWIGKNDDIALVYGNGSSALVNAVNGGNTVIEVTYAPTNYKKNIILYVYGSNEEMASSYIIAGEQSRYVINEGDMVSIGLVFGLRGYPEHEIPNIIWSTQDNTVIEVIGSGKKASVKGKNPGIGTITVQGRNGLSNSINIEIQVNQAGKAGGYYFSIKAEDRVKGILAGSSADIEVKVFNGDNEVYNVSGIHYEVSDVDIVTVTAVDGGMHIEARAGKAGQSYITISHNLVDSARILIYTALDDYGLQNAYPILVEKTNYLLGKNDNIMIEVVTRDNDSTRLRNIAYDLEKKNGVLRIQESNKKKIVVDADNIGNEVILVKYNAEVVQRIYVSVTEGYSGSETAYLFTENIIGLVLGQEYTTSIQSDRNYGIEWKFRDDGIISEARKVIENGDEDDPDAEVRYEKPSDQKTIKIKGDNAGQTILNVQAGYLERSILVFVCQNEDELRNYQAVNVEQRIYKLRKGENATVNIHSYQGGVKGDTRYGNFYNTGDLLYGNVIEINTVENNKISFKGINEGAAAIKITNEYYQAEIVVYIEVYPASEGSVNQVNSNHYITANKTLYIVEMGEQNVFMNVSVKGENFYGDAYWRWHAADESVISLNAAGRDAYVTPKKEGYTVITVSNRDCINNLEITVIVGERLVVDNSLLPFIYVEKNLIEVTKDAGSITLPYSIRNIANVNTNNISWRLYNNNISISNDAYNSQLNITVNDTGIARFDLIYGELRRDIYIVVRDVEVGNVYLTTSENYVIAALGELRMINIQMIGYEELDSSKFVWDVTPKNGVVTLVGNGTSGQIYGLSEGDAVIAVKHNKAPYPLKINVKVVKDRVKENVVYLTTQRNVIETVAGTMGEQLYVQKIGGDINKTYTTWTVDDESIIKLNGLGYSAQFNAEKEGVTRIKVKNEETDDYTLEIVVIVNPYLGNGVYIDTESTLFMMSPGEVQKRIGVHLVNGQEKDNNSFTYEVVQKVTDENLKEVSGTKVIDVIHSNNEFFINAINEGTADLIVRNSKAERSLTITVYVTHYQEIMFSSKTKEIVIGENEFIGINLPTYEYLGNKVNVWVETIEGGGASHILDYFYTNELVLLSGKSAGHVVVKAQIKGKEEVATLYVSVVESADPDVNRIVVTNSLYVLNEKSSPVTVDAIITGPNIFDVDQDLITWKIGGNPGVIDIMPKNSLISDSIGRQIQITPKKLGTATITVSHSYLSRGPGAADSPHAKTISIIVSELNNIFSVTPTEITVNTSRPETARAEIIGGTTKDYNEIKWMAKMQQKYDGTMLEIVRVMGSGREVILYPINEGEADIYVFYGTYKPAVIKVKVESDYFFSFRTGNEYMWPGWEKDLPFDIRPAGSNINWIMASPPEGGPVITYGEVVGSAPGGEGKVQRFLRVKALREGKQSIVGMANGKISTVNIIVQYDYSFAMEQSVKGEPFYQNKNASGAITKFSDGITYANYTIHPADTYIMPDKDNYPGLIIEVEHPTIGVDMKGRTVGFGKVKFTGTRELVEDVTFKQYKSRTNTGEPHVQVEGSAKSPSERTCKVRYYFDEVTVPIPYFVRGDGKYSNISNSDTTSAIPVKQPPYSLKHNGFSSADMEKIVNNTVSLGDGEVHYILLDKDNDVMQMNVTEINDSKGTIELGTYKDANEKELVKFTASIVDVKVDGIDRKAIRLDGGNDYIEYKRVAYNKELMLSVKSDYAKIPAYNGETVFNVFRRQYEGISTTLPNGVYLSFANNNFNEQSYNKTGLYYFLASWGKYVGIAPYHYAEFKTNTEYFYYTNIDKRKYYYNGRFMDNAGLSEEAYIMGEGSLGFYDSYYSNKDKYDEGYAAGYYVSSTKNVTGLSQNVEGANVPGSGITSNSYETYTQASQGHLVTVWDVTVRGGTFLTASQAQQLKFIRFDNYGNSVTVTEGDVSYRYKMTIKYYRNNKGKNIFGWKVDNVYNPAEDEIINAILTTNTVAARNVRTPSNDRSIAYGKYSQKYFHGGSHGWTYDTSGEGIHDSVKGGILFSEAYAQQKLEWEDRNSTIIVPYYIFNRWPYRYEGNFKDKENSSNFEYVPDLTFKENIVRISDGEGRPMPSLSRAIKYAPDAVRLEIRYEGFNTGILNRPNGGSVVLYIQLRVRPSHSQYVGSNTTDSLVVRTARGENTEIEGPITSFDENEIKKAPNYADLQKYLE